MAESKGAIRVVIEAVDKVTAPVRRIGAGVRSLLRGLELEKVKEQIGRVARGFADVAKAAAAMAVKVVGAGAAAAGALAAITRGVSEATAAQTRSARAVNMSLASYQALAHAANLVGGTSDEMASALGSLQGKALEAARGNWELRRAFRLMGVQIRDARGQMRPTADMMDDVANAFARVPDSARRTEAAMIIFGEAAIGLLPLLRRGAAGLREAREDARRLGLTMTETERESLAGFSRGMYRVRASITGVQNAIAVRLAPILTPLINQWADWIAANRELIATRVEEYIRAIPGVIAELRAEVANLWAKLEPVVSLFGEWIECIGPLHAALGGLFLVLGGSGLIASVVRFTAAIGAPVVAALGTFVASIVSGTGVMAAFNAVLLANPIGLVIAAIALLAAGAYLLYEHWDGVVAFFQRIWAGIKAIWNSGQVVWLRDVVARAFSGAADLIMRGWRGIVAFFAGIYNGIRAIWNSEQVAWLRDVVARAFSGAADLIMKGWRPVRQFFEWVTEGIVAAFEWVWDKIKPIVDAITAAARIARSLEGTGSGSDPQRQQQQRENWRRRGQNSGPAEETAAEIERRLYGDNLGARHGAADRPGQPPAPPAALPPAAPDVQPVPRARPAGANAQRVDAGGRLDIYVNQDGQVTRVEGRPNDRRISYDTQSGTGPYMGAPA